MQSSGAFFALIGVVTLCGACGDDGPAPAADAAVDAEVYFDADLDNGAVIHVTVVNDDGSLPLAGATVIFSDPAGPVVGQRFTGADGTAIGSVPVGGAVTAVWALGLGGPVIASTVTGLADGDELRFGGHGALPGASLGTMTASFTAFPDAVSYEVWNECTSATATGVTSTSVELEAFASCPAPPYDWIVTAFAADGNAIAFARATDLVWEPGSEVVIPDDWADVSPFTVTMQNVPLDFSDITIDRVANSERGGPLSRTRRELRAKGTLLGEILDVATRGTEMDVRIAFANEDYPAPQWQRAHVPEELSFVYDSEDALLPWVSPVSVEPTSRLAFWSATPAIDGIEVGSDAAYVQLHNDACADADPIVHWTIVAPGDTISVQLPHVDTDVLPRPTDCWRNTVTLVEDDLSDGYDDGLRADADLDLARLCAGRDRAGATRTRQSGPPLACD
jgi:hypothetical protein